MKQNSVYRLVLSALLLALALVLPLFLGSVQVLNQSISPMHIPALIAGLTLGPVWGGLVSLLMPLVRSLFFGMPPFPAVAVPMAFELAGYGFVSGLMYRLLRKGLKAKNHLPAMLLSLLIAMLAGRLVGGAAKAITMGLQGGSYTFDAFVSAYFVTTLGGALVHIIICPAITMALEAAGLSPYNRELSRSA